MKGQLIGEGNTAEVFCWGEKEVLKLFRQNFPQEVIEREYIISKEIAEKGIPVPRVGQIIEFEGRKGITYEKIIGKSMLNDIMTKPWVAKKYAKQLAQMQYEIHQCKVQDLFKYKETMEWNIRRTELLTEDTKEAVLNILSSLPEGEALCHGDLHPGNIIVATQQSYVLDWMTGTIGNPCADVARTLLLLRGGELPAGMPKMITIIINHMRNSIAKVYLKKYRQLSGVSMMEINQWRIPIAAARLTEWVSDNEKNLLLKEINETVVH